ncbi:MAG: tRNA pseudouridine synthase 1 [Marteilia pararefringens]
MTSSFSNSSSNKNKIEEKPRKIAKKSRGNNFVLIIGYNGSGFYGLVPQKQLPTIMSKLSECLTKVGFESSERSFFHSCSGRTDKGVSAAMMVLSLRGFSANDTKEKLQQILPLNIIIYDFFSIYQNFSARWYCNERLYSYTLPTYIFSKNFDRNYRIDKTILQRLEHCFSRFRGTHNFYNFTTGKTFDDSSCLRFITNLETCAPFVYKNDLEFIRIEIRGDSFMLHQIRNMMGLIVAYALGDLSIQFISKTIWENRKLQIPKLPTLGLVLEKLFYEKHSKKSKNCTNQQKDINYENYEKEIESFKNNKIYSHIYETESSSMPFKTFMEQKYSRLTFQFYDEMNFENYSKN